MFHVKHVVAGFIFLALASGQGLLIPPLLLPTQRTGPLACLFCLFHGHDIFAKWLKSPMEQDIMNFTGEIAGIAR